MVRASGVEPGIVCAGGGVLVSLLVQLCVLWRGWLTEPGRVFMLGAGQCPVCWSGAIGSATVL